MERVNHGLWKVFDIFLMGVLWLIGSLPLITFMASCSALYDTVHKCILEDKGYVSETFLKSYRGNLKRGVPLTVLFFAIQAVLLINMGILSVHGQGNIGAAGMMFYGIMTGLLLIIQTYATLLLSRFEMTIAWYLKAAVYMLFGHLPYSVLVMALVAGSILLIRMTPLALIVVPMLLAIVLHKIIEPLLKTYYPKQHKNK
ncbi:YesL family protein [Faecalicatena contorta]|uniref:Uncharacterized membrane protein YesL n=1 Tax=Faecalicatena contorta TaxID=39482 RepID=A0A315ZZM7_9FIRM|nr:YesL family protein [Faecalicatena contorta]PWJ50712.1 putative membrane protein YesL [Faecalicatena contorta]SUQ13280.1 Uncharacterized membrane protein YesL [Faecalicatena contorta]